MATLPLHTCLCFALSFTVVFPKAKRVYLNNIPRLRFKSDINFFPTFNHSQATDFYYNGTASGNEGIADQPSGGSEGLIKEWNKSAADHNATASSAQAVFSIQEVDSISTNDDFDTTQTDELISTSESPGMATNSSDGGIREEQGMDSNGLEAIYTDGSGQ